MSVNKLSIAPMIGWTDKNYRYLMRQITRETLLYTEMVNVGGLIHNPEKLDDFIDYDIDIEPPLALQLGGSDPEQLGYAVELCEGYKGGHFSEINLNCGCPSNKAKKAGFGAELMLDPELVRQITYEMNRKSHKTEITVKCRIGTNRTEKWEDLVRFVDACKQGGITRIIVHARLCILNGLSPAQNRTIPPLKYDIVHNLVETFPDMMFGINGGIKSFQDVDAHLGWSPMTPRVSVGTHVAEHYSTDANKRPTCDDLTASVISGGPMKLLYDSSVDNAASYSADNGGRDDSGIVCGCYESVSDIPFIENEDNVVEYKHWSPATECFGRGLISDEDQTPAHKCSARHIQYTHAARVEDLVPGTASDNERFEAGGSSTTVDDNSVVTFWTAHRSPVHSVMIGREAYSNPWLLADADRYYYGQNNPGYSRREVLERYLQYCTRVQDNGEFKATAAVLCRPLHNYFTSCGGHHNRRYKRMFDQLIKDRISCTAHSQKRGTSGSTISTRELRIDELVWEAVNECIPERYLDQRMGPDGNMIDEL